MWKAHEWSRIYQRYKSINLNKIQRSNMSECHRTKSLLKGIMIVFKTKGPQIRCIPHGRWGLAQCKSTCEEHAGSDKSFENVTLCLDRKNFRITPFINNAFCLINYASALLSSKTMVNSPEYCIYTSVINTYCVNKRGFQFLSFFYLFLPFSFSFSPSHSPTTLSLSDLNESWFTQFPSPNN